MICEPLSSDELDAIKEIFAATNELEQHVRHIEAAQKLQDELRDIRDGARGGIAAQTLRIECKRGTGIMLWVDGALADAFCCALSGLIRREVECIREYLPEPTPEPEEEPTEDDEQSDAVGDDVDDEEDDEEAEDGEPDADDTDLDDDTH